MEHRWCWRRSKLARALVRCCFSQPMADSYALAADYRTDKQMDSAVA